MFFRRGKVTFPNFFPAQNPLFPVQMSTLVDPKQISVDSKVTSTKKKKKKKLHLFPFQFDFSSFPYIFPSFLLHLHFFPSLFFPVSQKKISQGKTLGGTVPPTCYATDHYASLHASKYFDCITLTPPIIFLLPYNNAHIFQHCLT